jgi:hypothetical protein
MEQVDAVQQTTTTSTSQATTPVQTPDSYHTKKAIFRSYQVIYYILGLIEVLLVARVLLKVFGANAASPFVSFIYSLSDIFALPFAGIFGITASAGNVMEWSTLVAMAVYAVVAYGLVALFQLVKPTNPAEVEENV